MVVDVINAISTLSDKEKSLYEKRVRNTATATHTSHAQTRKKFFQNSLAGAYAFLEIQLNFVLTTQFRKIIYAPPNLFLSLGLLQTLCLGCREAQLALSILQGLFPLSRFLHLF